MFWGEGERSSKPLRGALWVMLNLLHRYNIAFSHSYTKASTSYNNALLAALFTAVVAQCFR